MANINDLINQTQKLTEEFNNSNDKQKRKKLQEKITKNFDQLNNQLANAELHSQKELEQTIKKLQNQFNIFDQQAEKIDTIQNIFQRSSERVSHVNQNEVNDLLNSISDQVKLEKKYQPQENQNDIEFRNRLNALNNYTPATELTYEELRKRLDALNDFTAPLPVNAPLSEDSNLEIDADEEEENELDDLFLDDMEESLESFIEEAKTEINDLETEKINKPSKNDSEPSVLNRATQLETHIQTVKNNAIVERENIGSPNEIRKDPEKAAIAKNKNDIIKSSTSFLDDLKSFFINPIKTMLNVLDNLFGSSVGKEKTSKNETAKTKISPVYQVISDIKNGQKNIHDELAKLKSQKAAAEADPKASSRVKHLDKLIALKEKRIEKSNDNIKNLKVFGKKCNKAMKTLQQTLDAAHRFKR